MKKLFVFLMAIAPVFADAPTEWKNVQQLDIAQPGLNKLSLPPNTLDAARPGLEDLRILDASGREVPYLIERPMQNSAAIFGPKTFSVSLSGQTTVISMVTGSLRPLDAVLLETPATSFIKAVTVEGSNDQQIWQSLASGQPIFRQPNGVSQLRVNFPAGSWPFLRLTVDDRRVDAIPFTGAKLHAATEVTASSEPLPVTMTERTENGSQTRLTLNLGAANLTLASLRIETTEPLFTRAVRLAIREVAENQVTEHALASDTIYRVAVEGQTPAARLDVPLDLVVPNRELLVLIENHDSPPLQISAVTAQRRPVYAVFRTAEPGAYRVVTGNARCPAPRYDLAALKGALATAPMISVAPRLLGALAANPSYRPAEPLPEIQDLGTVLDTADWKYRKPVQLSHAGVQQLTLDLETLAHADPSFRDLRLMRDGKQRPFILERTSLTAQLSPQVQSANDPKKPALSRWILKLPRQPLPITALRCTTRTPLFKRSVTLYEEITDQRGEKNRHNLSQADWVRTPPANNAPLVLTFSESPQSDTLILETDNGDNPPIELENFSVSYPVTRILFKALSDTTTQIYYGNPGVEAPRYDLDLVAGEILRADKIFATLGTEEPLKKSGWTDVFTLSHTTSIIFWGVLALVVIVLLVVLARLLPKTPQT